MTMQLGIPLTKFCTCPGPTQMAQGTFGAYSSTICVSLLPVSASSPFMHSTIVLPLRLNADSSRISERKLCAPMETTRISAVPTISARFSERTIPLFNVTSPLVRVSRSVFIF